MCGLTKKGLMNQSKGFGLCPVRGSQKSEAHRLSHAMELGKCFRKITVDGKSGSDTKSSEIRYKVKAKTEVDYEKDWK